MPTLLDIAERADVPIEGVVRTLTGRPVSEVIAARVREAVDDLGAPHPSMLEVLNTQASRHEPGDDGLVEQSAIRKPVGEIVPQAVPDHVERAHEQLLMAFAEAAAELEASLPQGVSSVVYEALRVEVEPMSERVGQIGMLVEQLTRVIRRLGDEVGAERHERLDDVKLLSDLLVASWEGIDRRLGRIERTLERLERDRDRPGI